MTDRRPVTARERLDFLFDAPSWRATREASWWCAGEGRVFGRPAMGLALSGGIDGALDAAFPTALADLAAQARRDVMSLVLLLDDHLLKADGATYARFHDALSALAGGRGPAVIAAILGPLTGPAALLARGADILFGLPRMRLSLADEAVARRVVPAEGDGSARADCVAPSEAAVLRGIRQLVAMLAAEAAPAEAEGPDDPTLDRLIGADVEAEFDAHRLLRRIVDPNAFVEIGEGEGLVASIARIGGRTVGLLCSDSSEKSGALGTAALRQAIRMLNLCERLSLPIVTILDSPGVIPDVGALDTLAELGYRWAGTQAPVVSLTVRRAIGAASFALRPPPAANRRRLHWPSARMGFTRVSVEEPLGTPIAPAETRRKVIAALREIAGNQP